MADPRILAYRDATLAMERGQFDHDVPQWPQDEIGQLGSALARLAGSLEQRFAEIRHLGKLSEDVGSGLLLDETLDHVYDAFQGLIPYDRIGFALLDEDGRTLRAHWARTNYSDVRLKKGFAARMAGSSLEQIMQTGQPRILNDLVSYLVGHPHSHSTRLMVDEGILSSLTCPLLVLGKAVGFMFFSSRQLDAYQDAHVALFQQIAGQLAMIVEKSRLYTRLVELDAQRSAVLGVVAHDLRNPIGVVLGYARLLRRERFGPCTEAQAGVLERMERSCDGMLGMVNDLLDAAAIEAGQVRLQPVPVDLKRWLPEVIEAERLLASAKQSTIELAVQGPLPAIVMDPGRMGQVLSNLLSNAVKFSPGGAVVRVSARVREAAVEIAVADQGPGVPADELPRLFQPFGRTSVRPTAGEPSTGLGLAICRKIAEAHGGTVRVESTVGRGSTFIVSLPLAGAVRTPAAA